MRRMVSTLFLGVLLGFLASYVVGPPARVAAQSTPAPAKFEQPPDSILWTAETLQKLHATLQAAHARGEKPNTADYITVPPGWRFNHRVPGDQPVPSAEMHEHLTDFWVVLAGSGTVGIGGEIENPKAVTNASGPVPGEWRGWPVKNGRTIKVKGGDLVNMPPRTVHWAEADKGGMTFLIIKAQN